MFVHVTYLTLQIRKLDNVISSLMQEIKLMKDKTDDDFSQMISVASNDAAYHQKTSDQRVAEMKEEIAALKTKIKQTMKDHFEEETHLRKVIKLTYYSILWLVDVRQRMAIKQDFE